MSMRRRYSAPEPRFGVEPGAPDVGGIDVGGDADCEGFTFAFVANVVDGGFIPTHLGRHSRHLDDVQMLADVGDAAVVTTRAGRLATGAPDGRIDPPAALQAHLPGMDIRLAAAQIDPRRWSPPGLGVEGCAGASSVRATRDPRR